MQLLLVCNELVIEIIVPSLVHPEFIQEIVKICRQSGRRFWYLVEENNAPSIRAVEKIGFYRFGMGERTKRMGLSLLGTFEVSGKT